MVAAFAVNRTAHGIDQETILKGLCLNDGMQFFAMVKGCLGDTVLHEL